MEVNSALGHLLVGAYFPGIHDVDLPIVVSHLLSSTHPEHRRFTNGPLRQLLLSTHSDPVERNKEHQGHRGRGVLRLHLANGFLYELHLFGKIDHAIHRVHTIAEWLIEQVNDIDQFERYDAVLTQLVGIGAGGEDSYAVHLARRTTVAPPPGVRTETRLKIAFTGLNMLRQEYGLPPLQVPPKQLEAHIAASISRARSAVGDYLDGLDQVVLGTIRHFSNEYRGRYDDLMVYNFLVSQNPQSCRNRIQAVHELPWLLRTLSGMDTIQSYDASPVPPGYRFNALATAAIIQAIDTGKPLFAAVAKALSVPKETIRWTRRRMLPYLEQLTGARTDLLLPMLSWLPPEKRPETDADWRAMRRVIRDLLAVCAPNKEYMFVTSVLTAEPRYRMVLANWSRELVRTTIGDATRRMESLRQAGNGPDEMNDYLGALRGSLRRFLSDGDLPDTSPAEAYHRVLLDWLATQPFHRVIAMSRRWHASMWEFAEQQRRLRPSADHPDFVRWPPVLREPVQINELTIVELTDGDRLLEEGAEMRHCIGGYSARCAMAESLVVSIRSMDGRRLSTAELGIQGGAGRIFVREHKGKQNRTAPEECEVAVAELVKLLNGPAYQAPIALRRQAGLPQRRNFEASMEERERNAEHYRRAEEYNAWSCALGQPPAEKSLPLSAIFGAHDGT